MLGALGVLLDITPSGVLGTLGVLLDITRLTSVGKNDK